MRTYVLAGGGCLDNPALGLVEVLERGEERVRIGVREEDLPEAIVREVVRGKGYVVESVERKGEITYFTLKKERTREST